MTVLLARSMALALLCLALAQGSPTSLPSYDMSFVGSDYGDLIADVRQQLESASSGTSKSDPGSMGRILYVIKKIRDDILREQKAADEMYSNMQHEYSKTVQKLNGTISYNNHWVETVDKKVIWNAERIVNLSDWLRKSPNKIIVKQEEIKQETIKIQDGASWRNKENFRFRLRERDAKETILGINHVLEFVTGAKAPEYKTNLKNALTADKPRFRELMAAVAPTLSAGGKTELHQLGLHLKDLLKEYHQFLTTLYKHEVKQAHAWEAEYSAMSAQKTSYEHQLAALNARVAKSKAEISALTLETEKARQERPDRIDEMMRAREKIDRLNLSHAPLVKEYIKGKTRRHVELKAVQELQTYIDTRFSAGKSHLDSVIDLHSR